VSLLLILFVSSYTIAQETYYKQGNSTVLNAIVLQEDGYFPFHRMVVLKSNNQEEHFGADEVSEYKTIRGKIYYAHQHGDEYIFVRKVLEGKMSLYEHISKKNEKLFFVYTESAGLTYLSPKARRKSGYKKMLDSIWEGCEENRKKIETTTYSLNALIRIVKGHNKCKPIYTGNNQFTFKGGISQIRTDIANPGDPDVPISPAVYINLDPKDVNSVYISLGYEKAIRKSDLSWIVNADYHRYSSIASGTFSVQQFQDRVYGFDFNYSTIAIGPGLKIHFPITEELNISLTGLGQFLLYLNSDISVLERKFEDGIVTEENNYELDPSGANFSIGGGLELEYDLSDKWTIKGFSDYRLLFRGERVLSHNILAFGVGLGYKL
jgi:hypothetical protein